jgi:hypothetical protein
MSSHPTALIFEKIDAAIAWKLNHECRRESFCDASVSRLTFGSEIDKYLRSLAFHLGPLKRSPLLKAGCRASWLR